MNNRSKEEDIGPPTQGQLQERRSDTMWGASFAELAKQAEKATADLQAQAQTAQASSMSSWSSSGLFNLDAMQQKDAEKKDAQFFNEETLEKQSHLPSVSETNAETGEDTPTTEPSTNGSLVHNDMTPAEDDKVHGDDDGDGWSDNDEMDIDGDDGMDKPSETESTPTAEPAPLESTADEPLTEPTDTEHDDKSSTQELKEEPAKAFSPEIQTEKSDGGDAPEVALGKPSTDNPSEPVSSVEEPESQSDPASPAGNSASETTPTSSALSPKPPQAEPTPQIQESEINVEQNGKPQPMAVPEDLVDKFSAQLQRLEENHNAEMEEMKRQHARALKEAQTQASSRVQQDYAAKMNKLEEDLRQTRRSNTEFKTKLEFAEQEKEKIQHMLQSKGTDLGKASALHRRDIKILQEQLLERENKASQLADEAKAAKKALEEKSSALDDLTKEHAENKTRLKSIAAELKDRRVEFRELRSAYEAVSEENESNREKLETLQLQLSNQTLNRTERDE